VWDTAGHARDFGWLRLFVPIPASEDGVVFIGSFNASGTAAIAGPGERELRH